MQDKHCENEFDIFSSIGMRFIPTEYIMTMESRLIGIEAKDIRASFQSAQNIAT